MPKYSILIFFILFSFSYVKENINPNILSPLSDEAEDYTSYLIEFFSGMVGNVTNSRCIKNLENQRDKYTELISEIMNLEGDLKFDDFTRIYGFRIIKMPGFLKDCQLAFLFRMYFMLTNIDKIKYIGYKIVNNSLEIVDSINSAKDGNSTFFKALGSIIRLSFDLKFKWIIQFEIDGFITSKKILIKMSKL